MHAGSSTASLYGQDLLNFVTDFRAHANSAYETALYLMTHGHLCPMPEAAASLGFFDRAAFDQLEKHRDLPITVASTIHPPDCSLVMYVNSLGRLHIRQARDERVNYYKSDRIVEVGSVSVAPTIMREIVARFASITEIEARSFTAVKRALDVLNADGKLFQVLEEVIDHVGHVESVCFYVGDKFLARVDQFSNLIDSPKGRDGFLNRLQRTTYSEWTKDDVLVVAALHALFLSGRAVRFEEFNGVMLSASGLWEKLQSLLRSYNDLGCNCELSPDTDLFHLARVVREQSLKSVGSPWLRYRRIYGLTFQKIERILPYSDSKEDPLAHLQDFGADFEELLGRPPNASIREREFFIDLAQAALDRDIEGIPCRSHSNAVRSWIEHLIERIVVSAIITTSADYGMSSSLRDASVLVEKDDKLLVTKLHALEPKDFFTCFASVRFRSTLSPDLANAIALSVQRRMMFNRWHFIPGNLERAKIAKSRHWYYPPVIPDIAIHSDMHRAAHAQAQVKFSIRAPGPDMSMPPLVIGNRPYRGFYDVRVVRMRGEGFTIEDMLRTRRRMLWMECIYSVLVNHIERGRRLPVIGFQPGHFVDIESESTRSISTEAGNRSVSVLAQSNVA
jgi:hypothetical protein